MSENSQRTGTIVHVMSNPCGRPRKIPSAEALWDFFVEYCEWIDNNPWQVKSASNSLNEAPTRQGEDSKVSKRNGLRQDVRVIQRAYTLYGFCAFAGIHSKWADFKRTNINRKGFEPVICAIENAVCAQQLDGALIHQFDGGIVARLNGLADAQVAEIKGDVFKLPTLTDEDLKELKRINGV